MAQPANLLQLQNGNKSFGLKTLFADARVSINEGEHIGVIGPNGAGKTTLFKILVGLDSLDQGEIIRSTKLRIGYLEQEAHEPINKSAEDYLEVTATKPLWELKALGKSLGLSDFHFAQTFHQLSGGYRMRMKLLALIGREPNLMLLDEPTNFLDLESVMALENFLQSYDGAFLLISHDREFLRRTTEHTLEVEQGEITKFPGNIDDYFEQKAMLREVLEAQVAHQEAKRKRIEDFVARFGAKATKAKQVQSRIKELEKIERIEIPPEEKTIHFSFPQPKPSGRVVAEFRDVSKSYGDKLVLSQVNFAIERHDRVALVGVNGAGKSTLIKLLAGAEALTGGSYTLGHNAMPDYFAQDQYKELDPSARMLDDLMAVANGKTVTELRSLLGCFLFSEDDVYKPIGVLSGGERNRYALARLLLNPSNFLLLDEPTNHLDMRAKDVLLHALEEFTGTVVFVSHDRYFIDKLATRVFEIEGGRVQVYPGNYEDYLYRKAGGAPAPPPPPEETREAVPAGGNGAEPPAAKRVNPIRVQKLKRRLAELEESAAALEAEIAALESSLQHFVSAGETQRQGRLLGEKRAQLAAALEEWEAVALELEQTG